jgi:hypothetical protein
MSVNATSPAPAVAVVAASKANLWQSMILGGAAASFAVNFTHPIVRRMKRSSFSITDHCFDV